MNDRNKVFYENVLNILRSGTEKMDVETLKVILSAFPKGSHVPADPNKNQRDLINYLEKHHDIYSKGDIERIRDTITELGVTPEKLISDAYNINKGNSVEELRPAAVSKDTTSFSKEETKVMEKLSEEEVRNMKPEISKDETIIDALYTPVEENDENVIDFKQLEDLPDNTSTNEEKEKLSRTKVRNVIDNKPELIDLVKEMKPVYESLRKYENTSLNKDEMLGFLNELESNINTIDYSSNIEDEVKARIESYDKIVEQLNELKKSNTNDVQVFGEKRRQLLNKIRNSAEQEKQYYIELISLNKNDSLSKDEKATEAKRIMEAKESFANEVKRAKEELSTFDLNNNTKALDYDKEIKAVDEAKTNLLNSKFENNNSSFNEGLSSDVDEIKNKFSGLNSDFDPYIDFLKVSELVNKENPVENIENSLSSYNKNLELLSDLSTNLDNISVSINNRLNELNTRLSSDSNYQINAPLFEVNANQSASSNSDLIKMMKELNDIKTRRTLGTQKDIEELNKEIREKIRNEVFTSEDRRKLDLLNIQRNDESRMRLLDEESRNKMESNIAEIDREINSINLRVENDINNRFSALEREVNSSSMNTDNIEHNLQTKESPIIFTSLKENDLKKKEMLGKKLEKINEFKEKNNLDDFKQITKDSNNLYNKISNGDFGYVPVENNIEENNNEENLDNSTEDLGNNDLMNTIYLAEIENFKTRYRLTDEDLDLMRKARVNSNNEFIYSSDEEKEKYNNLMNGQACLFEDDLKALCGDLNDLDNLKNMSFEDYQLKLGLLDDNDKKHLKSLQLSYFPSELENPHPNCDENKEYYLVDYDDEIFNSIKDKTSLPYQVLLSQAEALRKEPKRGFISNIKSLPSRIWDKIRANKKKVIAGVIAAGVAIGAIAGLVGGKDKDREKYVPNPTPSTEQTVSGTDDDKEKDEKKKDDNEITNQDISNVESVPYEETTQNTNNSSSYQSGSSDSNKSDNNKKDNDKKKEETKKDKDKDKKDETKKPTNDNNNNNNDNNNNNNNDNKDDENLNDNINEVYPLRLAQGESVTLYNSEDGRAYTIGWLTEVKDPDGKVIYRMPSESNGQTLWEVVELDGELRTCFTPAGESILNQIRENNGIDGLENLEDLFQKVEDTIKEEQDETKTPTTETKEETNNSSSTVEVTSPTEPTASTGENTSSNNQKPTDPIQPTSPTEPTASTGENTSSNNQKPTDPIQPTSPTESTNNGVISPEDSVLDYLNKQNTSTTSVKAASIMDDNSGNQVFTTNIGGETYTAGISNNSSATLEQLKQDLLAAKANAADAASMSDENTQGMSR